MNVLHSYTIRSLLKNKTRTLVTLIGIILSMALFTAVLEGGYSAVMLLVRNEEYRIGAYHGMYSGLSNEECEIVSSQKEIKAVASMRQVGWAKIDNDNEYKPYLSIKSISDDFENLVSVHITVGRMPENENEILLPNHLTENGGKYHAPGESISLLVGERISEGYALSDTNPFSTEVPESIENASDRTFTVVGYYDRFDYDIEPFTCPGYMALTRGGESGQTTLFFSVDNPREFFDFISQSHLPASCDPHTALLALYGALGSSEIGRMILGFACVLLLLVAFCSVSLIYNAFSISLSERTREFGILKSVGTTGRQISNCVYYEAVLLCLVAIPIGAIIGCLGIGITLHFLEDAFAILLSEPNPDIKMKLVVSMPLLLVSAGLLFMTVILSALVPALRVSRLAVMDSVRQTKDIKISSGSVRVSFLTKNLFGFEGILAAKNFKRNKKRYRSIILSLFMSIVLFISASSFCAYLTDSVKTAAEAGAVNQSDIVYNLSQGDDAEEILTVLRKAESIEKISLSSAINMPVEFPSDCFTEAFSELYSVSDTGSARIHFRIVFMDDQSYEALIRENGIVLTESDSSSLPEVCIVNKLSVSYFVSERKIRYRTMEIIDSACLPINCQTRSIPVPSGYGLSGESVTQDGMLMYYVYPVGYTGERSPEEAQSSGSQAIILTESDVHRNTFTLNAYLNDFPYFNYRPDTPTLFCPMSMRASIEGENAPTPLQMQINILSSDHEKTYRSMQKLLKENGFSVHNLYDLAADEESERMFVTVINVFSYGFIVLISLIALANVFNTISTSVTLRRREFAMLRSVGMNDSSFRKSLVYECLLIGLRALAFGLPVSAFIAYFIYKITSVAFDTAFYIPPSAIVISVSSVFIVVLFTMLYALKKIRSKNPIEEMKNENL